MTNHELLKLLLERSYEPMCETFSEDNPLISIIFEMAEPDMVDVVHKMGPEYLEENPAITAEMQENSCRALVAQVGKHLRSTVAECALAAMLEQAQGREESQEEETAIHPKGSTFEVLSDEEIAEARARQEPGFRGLNTGIKIP